MQQDTCNNIPGAKIKFFAYIQKQDHSKSSE